MKIFKEKVLKFEKEIADLQNASDRLSILRLIVFVLSVILMVGIASADATQLAVFLGPVCIAVFILLVKKHNKTDDLREYTSFLKKINEQEELRQDNILSGFPTGEEYGDRDHPYASDLDMFGKHSIFQLMNRATTEAGRKTLARWLTDRNATEDVSQRQHAVKELAVKLEWRQHLQASGMKFNHTAREFDNLRAWTERPARLLSNRIVLVITAIVLSTLSTMAAVYFFSHILIVESADQLVPYLAPLALMITVNTFVLRRIRPGIEGATADIHDHMKILAGYRQLIHAIESEKFESPKIHQLMRLINTNRSAVVEIGRLERALDILKLKGGKRQFNNMFYGMFNSLWFFDVYLGIFVEQWKERNRMSVAHWSNMVGEFEALSSIGGFYYANPTYTFPLVDQEDFYGIRFKDLGHPLIHKDRRVCNDFALSKGRGSIAMITGSNMAGKSTFLRTVGINIVLSMMGAPCCASFGRVSRLAVFTSMRTQDNLEEGVSSFYAELKRIEQLLKQIEEGYPIFFLLDEIFKGTNSKDRHKGSVSLMKQLVEANAFGMISTHDLELATLTEQGDMVSNYSFNSTLSDGMLEFDYRLTTGLCTDFNASELMKRSGIRIISTPG